MLPRKRKLPLSSTEFRSIARKLSRQRQKLLDLKALSQTRRSIALLLPIVRFEYARGSMQEAESRRILDIPLEAVEGAHGPMRVEEGC